jgi:hypothetical protein
MKIEIIRDDIDFALAPSIWDLGNQVLYSLCQNYPKHDRGDAIIAKVWLIGRSYAAAIERRKNAESTSDNFYETTVVDKIKQSKLDEWLEILPNRMTDAWVDLGPVIALHKQLMNVFSDMTGLENRALASKYLHFHRPDLFFIYDSRAREAISNVSPRLNQIKEIKASDSDPEYLAFCRRCQWLMDNLKARFDEDLTPRQIDKILLRITDKIKKPRTSGCTGSPINPAPGEP